MAESNPNDDPDAKTIAEATVLTPPPSHGIPVSPPAPTFVPRNNSAFGEAMGHGTGGLHSPMASAVRSQNLLDDKLILSATRIDVNGRTVPVLGGIHLLAKLGQGGMGAVYYGVHPRLHQEVAVKVLPFHLAEQQPGMIQRFIREAQIAAKVRSPHLVGVIDVNEENGLFYLVMEFVSGKSAGEYLRSVTENGTKGLPEATALEICIGAAEGLAVAHAHGVIHRDIKPDNIMIPLALARSGGSSAVHPIRAADAPTLLPPSGDVAFSFKEAKLADLGLARNETGDQSMTGANVCMGTPGYMAPEQASDAKSAGKPADVFALGATLYALLAGDSPFKGSSLMQTLNLTANTPHPPIQSVRPDISLNTSMLLDRCLAKHAEERYLDAQALLDALRICRETLAGNGRLLASDGLTMVYATPPHLTPGIGSGGANTPSLTESINPLTGTINRNPPVKSNWFPALAGILMLVLGAGGIGGFLYVQKIENEKKAAKADHDRREAQRILDEARAAEEARQRLVEDDKREVAFQEERHMFDVWAKAQKDAEAQHQQVIKDTFMMAVRAAQDQKKANNLEGAIATLDSALKSLGNRRTPMRTMADSLLKDYREEKARSQEAFSSALKSAGDAKQDKNWEKTIQILDSAFAALGNQTHTGRTTAEALLKEARDEKKRALDVFSVVYKSALDLRREQKWEKISPLLEDALKALGTQAHPDRAAAETLLKDSRDERERLKQKDRMVLEALPTAINTATEYKRVRNWDGVVIALEEPLKAIGTQTHPNRAVADALLKEARDQKERIRLFKIEIDKGNDWLKKEIYDTAKSFFENARTKLAQEPAEIAAANEGLRRVTEGQRKIRLSQGHYFMTQGRSLRPDNKNSTRPDWMKAVEAFKNAASIFTELDMKDELARADYEQADCWRKDNNTKTGDWGIAAGLYSDASLLYAGLGDKKSQADAVSRHAACVDPEFNPAGSYRSAAPLYLRAAVLFGDVGNKHASADNYRYQGTCIAKEKQLSSHATAAEIFKRAAALYEELGDKKLLGVCLYNQAFCLIKERKSNMTPEAKVLFTRASKLCRDAGDEATAKLADDFLSSK